MSIIEIEPGAEASAKVLNDNFKYLDEAITASFATLENRVNSTTSNISNISSNLSTIQGSISATNNSLEEVSNSKASKDLSDAEPSAEFKASILDYVAPDLTAGYSVSSGWTAPKTGWLALNCHSGEAKPSSWYIGGKLVAQNSQGTGGNGRAGGLDVTSLTFIGKGQTLTKGGSNTASATFYPCMGN